MIFKVICIIALSLSLGCSSGPTQLSGDGGGTRVGNPVTGVVKDASGNVVSGATVRIRRADFIAENRGLYKSLVTVDTKTDLSGVFHFDTIDSGNYRMEILTDDSLSTVIELSTGLKQGALDLGASFVKQLAYAKGTIVKSENDSLVVFVRGLERFAPVDAQGNYVLHLPPAQNHVLHVKSLKSLIAPVDFKIENVYQGDTVTINTITTKPLRDDLVGWSHRIAVYFNTGMSGAMLENDVRDFPVLIRFDSSSVLFAIAASDGRDLRFVTPNGKLLASEIEMWDSVNKKAAVWVMMDQVYRNRNELMVYCYFGNKNAPSLPVNNVFTKQNGFYGVWHMNGSGNTSSLFEAKGSNATSFTGNELSITQGIAGNAAVFNGIDDSLIASLHFDTALVSYSISMWIKFSAPKHTFTLMSGKINERSDSIFMWNSIDSLGKVFLLYDHFWPVQRTQMPAETRVEWGASQWHYCVLSLWGANRGNVFINNYRVESDGYESNRIPVRSANVILGGTNAAGFLNGIIDEVRIEKVPTNDWIQLCYQNQRTDQKFISYGPAEALGK